MLPPFYCILFKKLFSPVTWLCQVESYCTEELIFHGSTLDARLYLEK